jgi:hypothetical protein
MTVGFAVVATALAVGYVRKSAATAIKAGTKADDTLAGKLGLL